MSSSGASLISATVILSILIVSSAELSRTPCHFNKKQLRADECYATTIPAGLCPSCKLKPWVVPKGFFSDCQSIYDVEAKGCMKKLEKYVEYNPCDTVRKEQVETRDEASIIGLDYFVYALCETCCDCIPMGSRDYQFDERKKDGTRIKVTRGNCPAHVNADICKIWPKVTDVKNVQRQVTESEQTAAKTKDDICSIAYNWKNSDLGKGWFKNPEMVVPNTLRKFMNRLTWKAQCRYRSVWEPCARLERAQVRL